MYYPAWGNDRGSMDGQEYAMHIVLYFRPFWLETTTDYQYLQFSGWSPNENHQAIIVQKSSRIHNCHVAMNAIHQPGVQILPDHPPQFPDLNPDVHVWSLLKRGVQRRGPTTDISIRRPRGGKKACYNATFQRQFSYSWSPNVSVTPVSKRPICHAE